KSLNLLTLRTLSPILVQGFTYDDLTDLLFFDELSQHFEVRFHTSSLDRRTTLCRQQHRIADRNANGFITDVERHNPHVFPVCTQFYTAIMKDNLCSKSHCLGGLIEFEE